MVAYGFAHRILVLALCCAFGASETVPVPLVLPSTNSAKLDINNEGLQVLKDLQGTIAPVVVIGPYRSGKSFLLNQLLGRPCSEGFGVGHTRKTETKGIWLWPEPVVVEQPDGSQLNLLYVDTEGFESTGKSNTYDDRIFALSSILSSVMLYNLPETIRESDVAKLSFAVELATAFYGRGSTASAITSSAKPPQQQAAVHPGSMIWVLQRDFLQGNAQAMLKTALQPVDNPGGDRDVAHLNSIRQSLSVIASSSSAVGLPQPHLNRTALCELSESEFDSAYLSARSELRGMVLQQATPKVINGTAVTGAALGELLERMVVALNERDIPTAGSIVDNFNRELVRGCLKDYAEHMSRVPLPAEAEEVEKASLAGRAQALARFNAEHFGTVVLSAGPGSPPSLMEQLVDSVEREHEHIRTSNSLASTTACDNAAAECEDELEAMQAMRLPSTRKFKSRHERCLLSFARKCVGPAWTTAEARLTKAHNREFTRFQRDYNDRLYNGLVVAALALIVAGRCVFGSRVLEMTGWVVFAFLEIYPKIALTTEGSKGIYGQEWWAKLIEVWEALIYNPVIDLEQYWFIAVSLAVAAWLVFRYYKPRCCSRRRRKKLSKVTLEGEPGTPRDLDV